MKRFSIFAFVVGLAFASVSHAQQNKVQFTRPMLIVAAGEGQSGSGTPAYCTAATPCETLTWTNGSDITATVTNNAAGVEISGPATAQVYRCTVTSTQTCAASSFSTAAGSPWVLVPVTQGQSLSETASAGGPFYDTSVSYGATYVDAVTLSWNSSGASAPGLSSALTFPAAPAAQPAPATGVTSAVVD
jgi:hypothetical protein